MSDNENRQLEQLFGGNTRIKATLEQTCGFSNKTSATDDAQPVFRDKQSLLRHVVQRAKSLGTWIEIEPLIGCMIGNGQENDVFISKDDLYAIKLNNFALLPSNATSLKGFFHRLVSHNELFPDDAYTILVIHVVISSRSYNLELYLDIFTKIISRMWHFLSSYRTLGKLSPHEILVLLTTVLMNHV